MNRAPTAPVAARVATVVALALTLSSGLGPRGTEAAVTDSDWGAYQLRFTLSTQARPSSWMVSVQHKAAVRGAQIDIRVTNRGRRVPHLVVLVDSFQTWNPEGFVTTTVVNAGGAAVRTTRAHLDNAQPVPFAWVSSEAHLPSNHHPYAWDLGSVAVKHTAYFSIGLRPYHSCCWILATAAFGNLSASHRPTISAFIPESLKVDNYRQ